MTAASSTYDGYIFSTKCFPARTLVNRRQEGGRHWQVAYRKAEEQKCRDVLRRVRESYTKCENNTKADTPHGITLDGPFLLQLHRVDEPSELCSIDISEQNLNYVKPEDLKVFNNVAYIDTSINSLSLGSFSSFVSLRELNLSLNGLCNMTFQAADFPHLEVLDLSHNYLSVDDIDTIGQLPCLKILHLTGNELHHLPPHLGCSNHGPNRLAAKEENSHFKALEVLMLDNNNLSSGVFSSLANLKRLKYLNLQGNHISTIPYLEPTGCAKPLKTSAEEQAEEKAIAHTEPKSTADQNVKRTSQNIYKEEYCGESSLPLPELQYLNLAENKIAEEEALMAVALFPMLREIDIHSNPLARKTSGYTQLLTYYLQDRLGITIKRTKTQEALMPPVKVSTDPKWKVKGKFLEVSKKPLLMDTPCPDQTQVGEREATPESLQENTEQFFVTQATDSPESEFDLQADLTEMAENEERHIGIQTAVRMLEHTLKNLNVYRDSKPKLDSIQTPYREREKKIKELPPLKPIIQPTERVDEMIKEIKASRPTTRREVPLSSAINSTGVNKEENKEARSLLRDMKTKYKMVHRKTMEQEASIESDNQNGAEHPLVQML